MELISLNFGPVEFQGFQNSATPHGRNEVER